MNLIKLLAASSIIVVALAGCASPAAEVAPVTPKDNATSDVVEGTDSSDPNDITVRAQACEEVVVDATVDKTSAEYKGCMLELEIPNLAAFVSEAKANGLVQAVVNEDGKVLELKAFSDSNDNKKMDDNEVTESYKVKTDVMVIEVQKDVNTDIEGTQVDGLSSMLFIVP